MTAADIISLGYCYTAPLDSQGAVDIASAFPASGRDVRHLYERGVNAYGRDNRDSRDGRGAGPSRALPCFLDLAFPQTGKDLV